MSAQLYQFPRCYVPPPCDSEPRVTDMRLASDIRAYRLGTLVTLAMWLPMLAGFILYEVVR